MARPSNTIRPKLGVLPPAQRTLWPELTAVPEQFRLAGGTGLALQLGHRTSVDFDFFAFEEIAPRRLLDELPFLESAKVVSIAPNTLNVEVWRGEAVKLSFFGLPRLKSIATPVRVTGPNVRLANPIEISAFKAAVVPQRVEVKVYQDIAALLLKTDIALVDMLAAAAKLFGSQYNPMTTLQALADLENPALAALGPSIRRVLKKAVLSLDPARLLAEMHSEYEGEMTTGTLPIKRPPRTSELNALAKRVIWFEPPEMALDDPVRFLCYLMARSSPEDLARAAKYFSREDFARALRHAPPGLFTLRAWRYWNLVLEGHTRRPLPRRFHDVEPIAPWG